MEPADYALLAPYLTHVPLPRGEALSDPAAELPYCWFLETGVASIVAQSPQGHEAEVGIVGFEGMVDVATLYGVSRPSDRCFIQASGAGYRVSSKIIRDACDASASLRYALLAFAYCLTAQVSDTALANSSYSLEQRLARWLLMSHDRVERDVVEITHEFLSLMLNVRRAGVTVSLQSLEKSGFIRGGRGAIVIVDRDALRGFAGEAYGTPEAVYERLILNR